MMKSILFCLCNLLIFCAIMQAQTIEDEFSLYQAAIPSNDLCSHAREITINSRLNQLHNAKATITEEETPKGLPITCIQSFENDLWFKFTTIEAFSHYKVVVNPGFCDTPAGLQALLIKADDCDAGNFEYVACMNPQEEQELRMFLHEPQAGVNYFIYVDGYDGTQCGFTLELTGETEANKTIADFKREEVDYYRHKEIMPYEPADVRLRFNNNETYIEWEDEAQSDALLFQVQLYKEYERGFDGKINRFGRIVMTVEAKKTVDIEQLTYRVIDNGRFEEGESYCYRIAKIDAKGNKSYSEPICITATLLKDLFVSVIVPQNEEGQYMFKYINKKKQDLAFRVLNSDYEEIKSLIKKKEPKGEGNVTINMLPFPPGEYFLKGECKEGEFLRSFVVE